MSQYEELNEVLNKLYVQLDGLEPTAVPEVRQYIEVSIKRVKTQLKDLED